MRVLLFAPPDVVRGFDLVSRVPNLGLVSLAGNIDPDLADVRVADLVLVWKRAAEYVAETVKVIRPDVVGFSSMTFQFCTVAQLAEIVKRIDGSIRVVVGGYHPTLTYDEEQAGFNYVDLIVRGEGESTFNILLQAISGRLKIQDVRGVSYKEDGTWKHNPPQPLIDFANIRLPRREVRLLKEGFHIFGRPLDVVETSRGCTFDCHYCCITQMYGRTFRPFPIDRVVQDIEACRREGAKSILFVDDNITLYPERLSALCDSIITSGYNDLDYIIQASVQGLTDEKLISKMAAAGFKAVFLGIESVKAESLSFLAPRKEKSGTRINTQRVVQMLRENGIIVVGGFIIGNPGETEEDFFNTVEVANHLRIDLPIFFLVTPYPKTRLRKDLLKAGLVINLGEYSQYSCFSANISTGKLSDDQINFLQWKMYQEWFKDWTWLRWNNIKRYYPLFTARSFLRIWPQYLFGRLAVKVGSKSEFELYRAETEKLKNVCIIQGRPKP